MNKLILPMLLIIGVSVVSGCTQDAGQAAANKTQTDGKTVNNSTIGSQPHSKNYENTNVSVGEESILFTNQSAIVENKNYQIRILEFYSVRCPTDENIRCELAFLDEIKFEIISDGKSNERLARITSPNEEFTTEAFGYRIGYKDFHKIRIIDTDMKTYAKLKIEETDGMYCEIDNDCVVVPTSCGTTVVNKEVAKVWEVPDGPVCVIGTYAENPRCENFRCTADYNKG